MTTENEKLPTQAALKAAINQIVASKAAYAGLRELLDRIGSHHHAEKVFSTVVDPAHDGFLAEITRLHRIVGGSERLNNSNLVFITRDETPCVYELDLPEKAACHVFHVQIQTRCAVHDGVFVEIGGGDGEFIERLMIGNTHISLARALKSFAVSGSTSHFFTIVAADDRLRLYLNGELLANTKRHGEAAIRQLRIGLMGRKGATLEASLLNLEVWSSCETLRELTENEDREYRKKLEACVEGGALEEAARLLQGNPVEMEERLENEILALVRAEIGAGDMGYRDWLFELLRPSLSEEASRRLTTICSEARPLPDVVARGITVEFLENPAEQYSLGRILQKRSNKSFNVLRDVSFTIYPGDRVGVIGQNGAGKSTLLRTITGLIPIETGEILMRGEYMLLKAGIGMRNELTGRENIYHAGAYLGLWGAELERVCREVIAFSELAEAIDRPYKFYSDGMRARLVFSLATSVRPDILLLDELLSAGDISFKAKAERRLEEFLDKVRVLIIVTHGIEFVRKKCNKALFLSKHGQPFFGDPEEAIARYLDEIGSSLAQFGAPGGLIDADSMESAMELS